MGGGEYRPGPVDYIPAELSNYRTMAPPPEETVPSGRRKKKLPPRHFDDAKPQTFVTPNTKFPPPRRLRVPGDAPRPNPGPFPILKPVRTGEYDGSPFPSGAKKQHKQRGKARGYDKRRYRNKRQKQKLRARKWYQKMRHNPAVKRDRKRRREHPERFKRQPGGGATDPADRAREWREKKRDGGAFFIIERGSPEPDPRPRRQLQQYSPDVPWHQVDDEGPNFTETGPWRAEPPLRAIRGASTLLAAARGTAAELQHRSRGLMVIRSGVSERGHTEFRVVGTSGLARRVRLGGEGPGRWASASCSCPFWVFGGPEYHARQGGYLLGAPRGLATAPRTRDPDGVNLLCKHVLAALRWGQRPKQGRTSVPTYQMKCSTCGSCGPRSLAASARPEVPCGECSGTMAAVLPDHVGFAQRGDDWVGRAQKLRGQMAARQARVDKGHEEQRRELPRLQPNVGGLRTDTWAEAARLARSQGLDPAPYEDRARGEVSR